MWYYPWMFLLMAANVPFMYGHPDNWANFLSFGFLAGLTFAAFIRE